MAKRFVHLSHAEAMRQHAMKRLFDRYGLTITNGEHQALSAMCADGRAPVVAQGHKGSTIHRVKIGAVIANAVFRPDQNAIVSFLPKGDRDRLTRTPVKQQQAGLAQR